MKWEHPDAVMRTRITGKVPNCYRCRHMTHGLNRWCELRQRDPHPELDFTYEAPLEDQPDQVCPLYQDRVP